MERPERHGHYARQHTLREKHPERLSSHVGKRNALRSVRKPCQFRGHSVNQMAVTAKLGHLIWAAEIVYETLVQQKAVTILH